MTYYPKNMPIQYIQETYLDVQQQFKRGVLLDVGYVLTKGTHLNFGRDINAVSSALLGPGDAQVRRPYPNFSGIDGALFDGTSNYNALQVHVEKRSGTVSRSRETTCGRRRLILVPVPVTHRA